MCYGHGLFFLFCFAGLLGCLTALIFPSAALACSSFHFFSSSATSTSLVDSGLATSTFQSQRTEAASLRQEAILRDLVSFKEGSQAPFRIRIGTLPKAMLVTPPEPQSSGVNKAAELDRISSDEHIQGTTHSAPSPSRDLWLPRAPNMDLARSPCVRKLTGGCWAASNVAPRHRSGCRPCLSASWAQVSRPTRPRGRSSLVSGRPLQSHLKSCAGLPPYPQKQATASASTSSRESIHIDLIGAERQILKLRQDFGRRQVIAPGKASSVPLDLHEISSNCLGTRPPAWATHQRANWRHRRLALCRLGTGLDSK